jgi:hypothetical protein
MQIMNTVQNQAVVLKIHIIWMTTAQNQAALIYHMHEVLGGVAFNMRDVPNQDVLMLLVI